MYDAIYAYRRFDRNALGGVPAAGALVRDLFLVSVLRPDATPEVDRRMVRHSVESAGRPA
jgi:hypothetical protein